MRRVVAVAVFLVSLSMAPHSAQAQDSVNAGGEADSTGGSVDVGVGVSSPGAPGGSASGGNTGGADLTVKCILVDLTRFLIQGGASDPATFQIGDEVSIACHDTDTGELVSFTMITWPGPAAPRIDPVDLAAHAKEKLELPLPAPRAWPSLDTPQITGIETWLHVDNFTAATRTATAGGVSATVHADPVVVDWNMGDGGWVSCHDAGPEFAEGSSTTCGYTFTNRSTGRDDGLFHGSVTITWHLWWDSNVGRGGDLGTVSRTTPIDWTVHELQALIN